MFSRMLRISWGSIKETKDIYWNNVSTLLHMDGLNNGTIFTDSTGKNSVTVIGNTKTISSVKQIGNASAYFDGNSTLTMPNSSLFLFGNGNFTIECWVRPANNNNYSMYCGIWTTADISYALRQYGGKFQFVYTVDNYGNNNRQLTGNTSYSLNTWYHIAVVRNGSTITLYVNGVADGTYNASTDTLYNGTSQLAIGRATNNGDASTCYIDELRITKGIARYTTNFTPQTIEFPNS